MFKYNKTLQNILPDLEYMNQKLDTKLIHISFNFRFGKFSTTFTKY